MAAIYMGIEDPFLVHHKGLVFRHRDSSGRPLFRTVDTFGDSLLMYLGAGHPRADLAEVYASDDWPRRRDTGGALAQRQTVRV